MFYLFLLLFFIGFSNGFSDTYFPYLIRDLERAQYWENKAQETLPLNYNHLLSTGYFTTPSARMSSSGEMGFGYAHVPPYRLWNGRLQPFNLLEISANYRIFHGVEDCGLSPFGFGDYADRGANCKVAIVTPEESENQLPGIALGVEDFMGTKKFINYFVVGTKVWMVPALETSIGWGTGRYTKGPSKGFFGGLSWFPFWHTPLRHLHAFALVSEYDPIDYKNPEREPHPQGRKSNMPINWGIKYQLAEIFHFSASWIRGKDFAWQTSLHYNWGKSKGLLPKIKDPPFIPFQHSPSGLDTQKLSCALMQQGFKWKKGWLEPCITPEKEEKYTLWLSLNNCRYREENVVRQRLQCLLAAYVPSHIDYVVVILESYALPCQKYVYPTSLLKRYADQTLSLSELYLLVPRQEASFPLPQTSQLIFSEGKFGFRTHLSPDFETFLGSSRGKFKYDLGGKANVEGFLPYHFFYTFQVRYIFLSTLGDILDFDFYHPSQILNVATDYVRYRQKKAFNIDEIYFQKSWNCGRGFFGRVSGGYFQVNYAGVAGEVLWYPANSLLAIGAEAAIVKKRSYTGLGFQSKIRYFQGTTPFFIPYNTLQQYFINFYLDIPSWNVFTQAHVGQFLARDRGVLLEVTRYFDNGLSLSGWISYTNAQDSMHGITYYNRGISLELPLDFFFRCSSRRVWNYGSAAWLRDAGYKTSTGKTLFNILNRERR